ncbi:thermonuclease family protein [Erythrobacter colymbi]|uniref:thermonuclease family protein n=1 Tax=Erythrobacter colymbi TaxID=1161202 RepID=UPI000A36DAE7|nr:thermonuclease family protein [Erythrobacter colymbi]
MLIVAITRAVAIIAAISLPTLAAANVIEGKAEVIDGDSLRVAGTEVRLFGVDAPEYAQTCFDNGATVPCGAMAKDALEGLIGGGVLVCVSHETDAYGRAVARCRTSGVDVGDALVSSGWATAFRRYSDEYVAAEARARASSAGIWQWDFQSPEDFRASQQIAAQQPPRTRAAAPATTARRSFEKDGMCLIKGNHSRRGDWIYHLPGMPYYDDTRAEAYFCTEAQAQAAGYRRAIVR